MRLTDEQFDAIRTGRPVPSRAIKAKARQRHKPGQMNGYERAYSEQVLEPQKLAGEILEYWFERFTLKLADDCRYTPDFLVQLMDGTLECHEVKGSFFEDDAKVKLKVAAEMFPIFTFKLCIKQTKKDGGGWKITTVSYGA